MSYLHYSHRIQHQSLLQCLLQTKPSLQRTEAPLQSPPLCWAWALGRHYADCPPAALRPLSRPSGCSGTDSQRAGSHTCCSNARRRSSLTWFSPSHKTLRVLVTTVLVCLHAGVLWELLLSNHSLCPLPSLSSFWWVNCLKLVETNPMLCVN